jgi:hypothetical protein
VHRLFIDSKKTYDSVRREVLYNILIEFGITHKSGKVKKMCLTERYSTDLVRKHLSDMLPSKNGWTQDVFSPLLVNFALEYAMRRVQVIQNGLKLNGTHRLLVYADNVNILGGSVHTVKKNTEALVVAGKETGLEVNTDKTKYLVMSRAKNAGRSHNIKIDKSYLERVKEFKYLGTTLTNQNSIQEEIKSRLKSGNACYLSVQNLLSSCLLSTNLKIKIYRTLILPVVFYRHETWSLTLWEERSRLRVFDNRVFRILGSKRDKVTGEERKLHEELNDLYASVSLHPFLPSRPFNLITIGSFWDKAQTGKRMK